MAKRIPLSFKDTPEETRLYKEILKHSCRAAFIKEAIKFYLAYQNNNSMITHQITDDIPIDTISEENNEIMDILG